MTQDREGHPKGQNQPVSDTQGTYYDRLGVNPTSTVQEIRQAYRELSKLYHPDTTQLAIAEAKQRFQLLNEAYATLSNPDKRLYYDQKSGFSRFSVIQPPSGVQTPKSASRQSVYSSSAYLDPNDRPLSAGEVFALVILGVTFVLCLVLAIVLSFAHSEAKFDLLRAAGVTRTESITADSGGSFELSNAEALKVSSLKASVNSEMKPGELDSEAQGSAPETRMPWLPSISFALSERKIPEDVQRTENPAIADQNPPSALDQEAQIQVEPEPSLP